MISTNWPLSPGNGSRQIGRKTSLADIKAQAEAMPTGDFRFETALAGKDRAFICEVKKASPSKGVIDPVFNFEAIAHSYEDAGADCVSCLTEPNWFLGSDEIFKKVRKIITRPMIRKDVTVDEYQIYQAKVLGADAVLLICTLLTPKRYAITSAFVTNSA